MTSAHLFTVYALSAEAQARAVEETHLLAGSAEEQAFSRGLPDAIILDSLFASGYLFYEDGTRAPARAERGSALTMY